METTKTIDFAEPIMMGTKSVEQINLREPTVGEVDKASKLAGFASAVLLISLVSGLERAIVEKMPITVFKEAVNFIEGFTKDAQETGES